jgi:hypothetical protein
MKNANEIYDIIYHQLGLKNLEAYKAYADSFFKEPYRVVTQEEIELLSPDNIDNMAFWGVAEQIFKTDPVSNCQYKKEFSIPTANRNNLNIYLLDGILSLLQFYNKMAPRMNVFEIGPGYGALKNWIEVNTDFDYSGVDCYPKINGIFETEPNGVMKTETVEAFKGKVGICVASNVFQHLSVRQRNQYYKDVHDMLVINGVFIVSQFYDLGPSNPYGRSADGKQWLRHYGQFTEIQTLSDILSDVSKYFSVDSITTKRGWSVLVLNKKNIEVKSPEVAPVTT